MKLLILLLPGLFLSGADATVNAVLDEACLPKTTPVPVTKPKPKDLDEACKVSAECDRARGPTACVNEKCKCAKDYSPVKRNTTVPGGERIEMTYCQINPGFNQQCTDECRSPFKCREVKPAPSAQNRTTTVTKPPRKVCECVEPFKLNERKACVLECQSDEVAASDGCHKRCNEMEIQLENLDCKPIVALNEACEMDQQCSAPFSECSNKQCACKSGFKADGGSCVPTVARCGCGEPLRSTDGSNTLVTCTRIGQNPVAIQGTVGATNAESGCPADYYCEAYDSPRGQKTNGICCPFPRPQCPVGDQHPTATCLKTPVLNSLTATTSTPSTNITEDQQCPSQTHFCYQRPVISGLGGSICCPRECPLQSILVNRQCLPLIAIGRKCKADEQCSGANGDCINGVCACPPKTKESKSASGVTSCVATCDPSVEVVVNNRCVERLKVGDQCRGKETRCALNSICNGAGICQCPCGMMSLNGILCAPPPTCPAPSQYSVTPFPKTTPKKPNKEDYEKAIYCRDPSREKAPIAEAVDTCPENYYCKPYVSSLGLCCQIPEPFCPYSSYVYNTCEPKPIRVGTSTPAPACKQPSQFCYQFFSGLGNITGNAVCCDTNKP